MVFYFREEFFGVLLVGTIGGSFDWRIGLSAFNFRFSISSKNDTTIMCLFSKNMSGKSLWRVHTRMRHTWWYTPISQFLIIKIEICMRFSCQDGCITDLLSNRSSGPHCATNWDNRNINTKLAYDFISLRTCSKYNSL